MTAKQQVQQMLVFTEQEAISSLTDLRLTLTDYPEHGYQVNDLHFEIVIDNLQIFGLGEWLDSTSPEFARF